MGGLQHFSVSPRPLGFGFGTKGFGAKGFGPGLDNILLSSGPGLRSGPRVRHRSGPRTAPGQVQQFQLKTRGPGPQKETSERTSNRKVWFSLLLNFNSLGLDSEVGRLCLSSTNQLRMKILNLWVSSERSFPAFPAKHLSISPLNASLTKTNWTVWH